MATITLKTGEVVTLNMAELREVLHLNGLATENVFDTVVTSKKVEQSKASEKVSGENREAVPYEKMGKRAKSIVDNARKHAPKATARIEYPKKGEKGNGWIWLENGEQFIDGLSPNWKWSKRRKAHFYDLNKKR